MARRSSVFNTVDYSNITRPTTQYSSFVGPTQQTGDGGLAPEVIAEQKRLAEKYGIQTFDRSGNVTFDGTEVLSTQKRTSRPPRQPTPRKKPIIAPSLDQFAAQVALQEKQQALQQRQVQSLIPQAEATSQLVSDFRQKNLQLYGDYRDGYDINIRGEDSRDTFQEGFGDQRSSLPFATAGFGQEGLTRPTTLEDYARASTTQPQQSTIIDSKLLDNKRLLKLNDERLRSEEDVRAFERKIIGIDDAMFSEANRLRSAQGGSDININNEAELLELSNRYRALFGDRQQAVNELDRAIQRRERVTELVERIKAEEAGRPQGQRPLAGIGDDNPMEKPSQLVPVYIPATTPEENALVNDQTGTIFDPNFDLMDITKGIDNSGFNAGIPTVEALQGPQEVEGPQRQDEIAEIDAGVQRMAADAEGGGEERILQDPGEEQLDALARSVGDSASISGLANIFSTPTAYAEEYQEPQPQIDRPTTLDQLAAESDEPEYEEDSPVTFGDGYQEGQEEPQQEPGIAGLATTPEVTQAIREDEQRREIEAEMERQKQGDFQGPLQPEAPDPTQFFSLQGQQILKGFEGFKQGADVFSVVKEGVTPDYGQDYVGPYGETTADIPKPEGDKNILLFDPNAPIPSAPDAGFGAFSEKEGPGKIPEADLSQSEISVPFGGDVSTEALYLGAQETLGEQGFLRDKSGKEGFLGPTRLRPLQIQGVSRTGQQLLDAQGKEIPQRMFGDFTEGEVISQIYARQLATTLENEKQKEYVNRLRAGEVSISDALLNPNTRNKYFDAELNLTSEGVSPKQKELIKTYFNERGIDVNEMIGSVKLGPVTFTKGQIDAARNLDPKDDRLSNAIQDSFDRFPGSFPKAYTDRLVEDNVIGLERLSDDPALFRKTVGGTPILEDDKPTPAEIQEAEFRKTLSDVIQGKIGSSATGSTKATFEISEESEKSIKDYSNDMRDTNRDGTIGKGDDKQFVVTYTMADGKLGNIITSGTNLADTIGNVFRGGDNFEAVSPFNSTDGIVSVGDVYSKEEIESQATKIAEIKNQQEEIKKSEKEAIKETLDITGATAAHQWLLNPEAVDTIHSNLKGKIALPPQAAGALLGLSTLLPLYATQRAGFQPQDSFIGPQIAAAPAPIVPYAAAVIPTSGTSFTPAQQTLVTPAPFTLRQEGEEVKEPLKPWEIPEIGERKDLFADPEGFAAQAALSAGAGAGSWVYNIGEIGRAQAFEEGEFFSTERLAQAQLVDSFYDRAIDVGLAGFEEGFKPTDLSSAKVTERTGPIRGAGDLIGRDMDATRNALIGAAEFAGGVYGQLTERADPSDKGILPAGTLATISPLLGGPSGRIVQDLEYDTRFSRGATPAAEEFGRDIIRAPEFYLSSAASETASFVLGAPLAAKAVQYGATGAVKASRAAALASIALQGPSAGVKITRGGIVVKTPFELAFAKGIVPSSVKLTDAERWIINQPEKLLSETDKQKQIMLIRAEEQWGFIDEKVLPSEKTAAQDYIKSRADSVEAIRQGQEQQALAGFNISKSDALQDRVTNKISQIGFDTKSITQREINEINNLPDISLDQKTQKVIDKISTNISKLPDTNINVKEFNELKTLRSTLAETEQPIYYSDPLSTTTPSIYTSGIQTPGRTIGGDELARIADELRGQRQTTPYVPPREISDQFVLPQTTPKIKKLDATIKDLEEQIAKKKQVISSKEYKGERGILRLTEERLEAERVTLARLEDSLEDAKAQYRIQLTGKGKVTQPGFKQFSPDGDWLKSADPYGVDVADQVIGGRITITPTQPAKFIGPRTPATTSITGFRAYDIPTGPGRQPVFGIQNIDTFIGPRVEEGGIDPFGNARRNIDEVIAKVIREEKGDEIIISPKVKQTAGIYKKDKEFDALSDKKFLDELLFVKHNLDDAAENQNLGARSKALADAKETLIEIGDRTEFPTSALRSDYGRIVKNLDDAQVPLSRVDEEFSTIKAQEYSSQFSDLVKISVEKSGKFGQKEIREGYVMKITPIAPNNVAPDGPAGVVYLTSKKKLKGIKQVFKPGTKKEPEFVEYVDVTAIVPSSGKARGQRTLTGVDNLPGNAKFWRETLGIGDGYIDPNDVSTMMANKLGQKPSKTNKITAFFASQGEEGKFDDIKRSTAWSNTVVDRAQAIVDPNIDKKQKYFKTFVKVEEGKDGKKKIVQVKNKDNFAWNEEDYDEKIDVIGNILNQISNSKTPATAIGPPTPLVKEVVVDTGLKTVKPKPIKSGRGRWSSDATWKQITESFVPDTKGGKAPKKTKKLYSITGFKGDNVENNKKVLDSLGIKINYERGRNNFYVSESEAKRLYDRLNDVKGNLIDNKKNILKKAEADKIEEVDKLIDHKLNNDIFSLSSKIDNAEDLIETIRDTSRLNNQFLLLTVARNGAASADTLADDFGKINTSLYLDGGVKKSKVMAITKGQMDIEMGKLKSYGLVDTNEKGEWMLTQKGVNSLDNTNILQSKNITTEDVFDVYDKPYKVIQEVESSTDTFKQIVPGISAVDVPKSRTIPRPGSLPKETVEAQKLLKEQEILGPPKPPKPSKRTKAEKLKRTTENFETIQGIEHKIQAGLADKLNILEDFSFQQSSGSARGFIESIKGYMAAGVSPETLGTQLQAHTAGVRQGKYAISGYNTQKALDNYKDSTLRLDYHKNLKAQYESGESIGENTLENLNKNIKDGEIEVREAKMKFDSAQQNDAWNTYVRDPAEARDVMKEQKGVAEELAKLKITNEELAGKAGAMGEHNANIHAGLAKKDVFIDDLATVFTGKETTTGQPAAMTPEMLKSEIKAELRKANAGGMYFDETIVSSGVNKWGVQWLPRQTSLEPKQQQKLLKEINNLQNKINKSYDAPLKPGKYETQKLSRKKLNEKLDAKLKEAKEHGLDVDLAVSDGFDSGYVIKNTVSDKPFVQSITPGGVEFGRIAETPFNSEINNIEKQMGVLDNEIDRLKESKTAGPKTDEYFKLINEKDKLSKQKKSIDDEFNKAVGNDKDMLSKLIDQKSKGVTKDSNGSIDAQISAAQDKISYTEKQYKPIYKNWGVENIKNKNKLAKITPDTDKQIDEITDMRHKFAKQKKVLSDKKASYIQDNSLDFSQINISETGKEHYRRLNSLQQQLEQRTPVLQDEYKYKQIGIGLGKMGDATSAKITAIDDAIKELKASGFDENDPFIYTKTSTTQPYIDNRYDKLDKMGYKNFRNADRREQLQILANEVSTKDKAKVLKMIGEIDKYKSIKPKEQTLSLKQMIVHNMKPDGFKESKAVDIDDPVNILQKINDDENLSGFTTDFTKNPDEVGRLASVTDEFSYDDLRKRQAIIEMGQDIDETPMAIGSEPLGTLEGSLNNIDTIGISNKAKTSDSKRWKTDAYIQLMRAKNSLVKDMDNIKTQKTSNNMKYRDVKRTVQDRQNTFTINSENTITPLNFQEEMSLKQVFGNNPGFIDAIKARRELGTIQYNNRRGNLNYLNNALDESTADYERLRFELPALVRSVITQTEKEQFMIDNIGDVAKRLDSRNPSYNKIASLNNELDKIESNKNLSKSFVKSEKARLNRIIDEEQENIISMDDIEVLKSDKVTFGPDSVLTNNVNIELESMWKNELFRKTDEVLKSVTAKDSRLQHVYTNDGGWSVTQPMSKQGRKISFQSQFEKFKSEQKDDKALAKGVDNVINKVESDFNAKLEAEPIFSKTATKLGTKDRIESQIERLRFVTNSLDERSSEIAIQRGEYNRNLSAIEKLRTKIRESDMSPQLQEYALGDASTSQVDAQFRKLAREELDKSEKAYDTMTFKVQENKKEIRRLENKHEGLDDQYKKLTSTDDIDQYKIIERDQDIYKFTNNKFKKQFVDNKDVQRAWFNDMKNLSPEAKQELKNVRGQTMYIVRPSPGRNDLEQLMAKLQWEGGNQKNPFEESLNMWEIAKQQKQSARDAPSITGIGFAGGPGTSEIAPIVSSVSQPSTRSRILNIFDRPITVPFKETPVNPAATIRKITTLRRQTPLGVDANIKEPSFLSRISDVVTGADPDVKHQEWMDNLTAQQRKDVSIAIHNKWNPASVKNLLQTFSGTKSPDPASPYTRKLVIADNKLVRAKENYRKNPTNENRIKLIEAENGFESLEHSKLRHIPKDGTAAYEQTLSKMGISKGDVNEIAPEISLSVRSDKRFTTTDKNYLESIFGKNSETYMNKIRLEDKLAIPENAEKLQLYKQYKVDVGTVRSVGEIKDAQKALRVEEAEKASKIGIGKAKALYTNKHKKLNVELNKRTEMDKNIDNINEMESLIADEGKLKNMNQSIEQQRYEYTSLKGNTNISDQLDILLEHTTGGAENAIKKRIELGSGIKNKINKKIKDIQDTRETGRRLTEEQRTELTYLRKQQSLDYEELFDNYSLLQPQLKKSLEPSQYNFVVGELNKTVRGETSKVLISRLKSKIKEVKREKLPPGVSNKKLLAKLEDQLKTAQEKIIEPVATSIWLKPKTTTRKPEGMGNALKSWKTSEKHRVDAEQLLRQKTQVQDKITRLVGGMDSTGTTTKKINAYKLPTKKQIELAKLRKEKKALDENIRQTNIKSSEQYNQAEVQILDVFFAEGPNKPSISALYYENIPGRKISKSGKLLSEIDPKVTVLDEFEDFATSKPAELTKGRGQGFAFDPQTAKVSPISGIEQIEQPATAVDTLRRQLALQKIDATKVKPTAQQLSLEKLRNIGADQQWKDHMTQYSAQARKDRSIKTQAKKLKKDQELEANRIRRVRQGESTIAFGAEAATSGFGTQVAYGEIQTYSDKPGAVKPPFELPTQQRTTGIDTSFESINQQTGFGLGMPAFDPTLQVSPQDIRTVTEPRLTTAPKIKTVSIQDQGQKLITGTRQVPIVTQTPALFVDVIPKITPKARLDIKTKPITRTIVTPKIVYGTTPRQDVIPKAVPFGFIPPPFWLASAKKKRKKLKKKKGKKKTIVWAVPDVWFGRYDPREYKVIGKAAKTPKSFLTGNFGFDEEFQ